MTDGGSSLAGYRGYAGVLDIPSSVNGKTVTAIGDDALAGSRISGVIIPDTVTSIESHAFEECSCLEELSISKNVPPIGDGVLCGRMRDLVISINPANEKHEILNGSIFDKTTNTVIQGDPSGIIPAGIQHIGNHSYSKFYQLKKVTISEGAVSIGRYAFKSWHELSEVVLPSSLKTVGHYGKSSQSLGWIFM